MVLAGTLTAPGALCPADLSPLDPIVATPLGGVAETVAAAKSAQPAWAAKSLDARAEIVRAVVRRVLEKREEIVRIMSRETGRSETECLMSEVAGLMDYLNAALRAARKALAPEPIKLSALDYPGKRAVVEAVPRGVIGIIAPWNFPVGNFWKSLFPALLAGNGVILKPSEHTPRSGAWLAEQCRAVLPSGLVGLVLGGGDAGTALIDAPIDAIVFTGSVRTGRKVAARAGERLIPCSVELGGKDAAIVLADCDLERTVIGIAQWAFMNAGQNCSGIERVYVEKSIAGEFVKRLSAVASALRVAPGKDGVSDLGPLQNEPQLRIVESHVEDARQKGAKVMCGGARTGHGYGYAATVVDGCTHEMRIVTEETFGPVVAVTRVNDAEEALRLANDSTYGLNGSVWTKDLARGEALARRMEVGVALVNNHSITGIMAELPWTGVKDTGFGVAASRHSYGTFVRRRTVFVDKSSKPDPWWFPSNEDTRAFGEAIVARNLGSLGALLKLAGLLNKRIRAIKDLASRS